MAQEDKNSGFTKEQLEALQIDSALGGDIPVIGGVGMIGRKGAKVAIDAAEPYIKKGVDAAAPYIERAVEMAKKVGDEALKVTHVISEKKAAEIAEKSEFASLIDMTKRGGLALGTIVGVSAGGATYMSNKAEEERLASTASRNKELAGQFKDLLLSKEGDKALTDAISGNGPLKGAALTYLSAKQGLMQDGKLDERDQVALKAVSEIIYIKIESEGPQAYAKLPNNLHINEMQHQQQQLQH
jgi:hypothetical protein